MQCGNTATTRIPIIPTVRKEYFSLYCCCRKGNQKKHTKGVSPGEDTMRKENKIYCNSCGKRIVDTIGRDMEEYIHIEKIWGYPSEKDGECHSFDLCEPCYDKMTAAFVLKPEIKEEAELL